METFVNVLALVVAALALAVSWLSWRASLLGIRASTYDRTYEIYADAERFHGPWMRDARPDMSMLPTLIGAWSRSHFLCSEEVTAYLRKLWLDAIRAEHLSKVIAGEYPGDHGAAVKEEYELLRQHVDFERLRVLFMPDLRVRYRSFRQTARDVISRVRKWVAV